jgi:hypothetical protein
MDIQGMHHPFRADLASSRQGVAAYPAAIVQNDLPAAQAQRLYLPAWTPRALPQSQKE